MRLFQMHHFAGLSCRLLRLIEPGDPSHHIRARLEQVDELLTAVLARLAELLESVQLDRQQRMCLFQLIELNEIAVTDCGNDLAGAVMLMIGCCSR